MPLILSWMGLCALTVWHAFQTRDLQLNERKHELRDVVEASYSIIAGLNRRVQSGAMTEEAAKQQALARLGDLRTADNGYLTIISASSVMVMHPLSPKLNGTDQTGNKDAKGHQRKFQEFFQRSVSHDISRLTCKCSFQQHHARRPSS